MDATRGRGLTDAEAQLMSGALANPDPSERARLALGACDTAPNYTATVSVPIPAGAPPSPLPVLFPLWVFRNPRGYS
ncbi:MAG: hypothetical protein ACREC5_01470, partial [Thermoplasmata archaeon]